MFYTINADTSIQSTYINRVIAKRYSHHYDELNIWIRRTLSNLSRGRIRKSEMWIEYDDVLKRIIFYIMLGHTDLDCGYKTLGTLPYKLAEIKQRKPFVPKILTKIDEFRPIGQTRQEYMHVILGHIWNKAKTSVIKNKQKQ